MQSVESQEEKAPDFECFEGHIYYFIGGCIIACHNTFWVSDMVDNIKSIWANFFSHRHSSRELEQQWRTQDLNSHLYGMRVLSASV